jgi:hypothetical protein
LVALSAYTLIGLVAAMDEKAVRARLAGAVPDRLSGGILAGFGLLFLLRAAGVLAGALIRESPLAETELALNSADFLFAPTWIICGILLFRRTAFGYLTGLGLLFQAGMLFIGLIILMLLQPVVGDTSIHWGDIAVVFAMSLICLLPFALYVRGVVSPRRSTPRMPDRSQNKPGE